MAAPLHHSTGLEAAPLISLFFRRVFNFQRLLHVGFFFSTFCFQRQRERKKCCLWKSRRRERRRNAVLRERGRNVFLVERWRKKCLSLEKQYQQERERKRCLEREEGGPDVVGKLRKVVVKVVARAFEKSQSRRQMHTIHVTLYCSYNYFSTIIHLYQPIIYKAHKLSNADLVTYVHVALSKEKKRCTWPMYTSISIAQIIVRKESQLGGHRMDGRGNPKKNGPAGPGFND